METRLENKKGPTENRNIIKDLVIIAGVVGLIYFAGTSFATKKQDEEVASVVEDAILGTANSDDSEQVFLMRQMFAVIQDSLNRELLFTTKLESSNLFLPESFQTKESLSEHITLLRGAIAELSRIDDIFSNVIQEDATSFIQQSSASEEYKSDFIAGMRESLNDRDQVQIRNARFATLQDLYVEALSLYEFMLSNFDGYSFEPDGTGQEIITFSQDRDLVAYQGYIERIESAQKRFVEADAIWVGAGNQMLNSQGVDLKVKDIQDGQF